MTEKDKISCCVICNLADSMKTCKTCPFRMGLAERKRIRESMAQRESETQKHSTKTI